VNRPESAINLSGSKDFDGLNLYGDEIELPLPLGIGAVHRTGWKEGDLLDNQDAKSMKWDVGLHYRLTDKIELSGNYRFGGGSSIYQGSQKYALRDFTQQFVKLELKGSNFFVRAYMTATDAGDSYNVAALGTYVNERIKPTQDTPTQTGWATEYVLAYQGAFIAQGVPAANHDAARAFADRNRPDITTAQGLADFKSLAKAVRNDYFQRNPAGAKFIDASRLYHGEFNYNFGDILNDLFEFQVGGNFRQYSLFSDGTIFNEDPDEGTDFERITINEYGFYGQASKTLAEALKLTASLRYDKNENFEGQVTPRFSAVYTFNESHNIRASFQTGFRNPDTQAQFIYFDLGTNTLLGSAKANAERYGLHEGGAYSKADYDAYRATGGTINPNTGAFSGGNPALVPQRVNIPYVGPEQLKSFELGYKGLFQNKVLVDLNGYYSIYNDFIGGSDYILAEPTEHQGNFVPAGKVYSPYVNFPEEVTSYGIGLGLSYNLPKGYQITGSYNYATFDDDANDDSEFRAGFNTPENKYTIGIGNRKLTKSLGFNVNYRWQDEFLWQSDFGSAMIGEFGVFDAQVSYKVTSIKTMVKIGGSNLLGGDYRTNFGGPFVGQQYYISLTFDEFLK
jgi:iron complex outermembrane recepter protein